MSNSWELCNWMNLLIPIITFIAGFYLKDFYEKKKERERIYKTKKYVIILLNRILFQFTHLKSHFDGIINKLEEEKIQSIVFIDRPSILVDKFNSIPHNDLYTALVSKTKYNTEIVSKHLINTIEAVNGFKDILEISKQDYKLYTGTIDNYLNRWNENIESMITENEKVIANAKRKKSFDRFEKDLKTIYESYSQIIDRNNPYNCMSEYIDPLVESCERNKDNELSVNFKSYTKVGHSVFSNILNTKESYIKVFSLLSKGCEKQRDKLKSSLIFYNEV